MHQKTFVNMKVKITNVIVKVLFQSSNIASVQIMLLFKVTSLEQECLSMKISRKRMTLEGGTLISLHETCFKYFK
jgi:hypothetical protein